MLDIKRIVPSRGCDIYLLQTKEKSAIIDTGMFHCADNTIKLLKEALGDRNLDFVILSHTHYDHVGGIPAIRTKYPGIKVYGAEYAAYVLERPGARNVMRQLSQNAIKTYVGKDAVLSDYDENALFVDEIIREGDLLDLGSSALEVYETPGHTKCCLTFFEKEEGILFPSESTGVYVDSSWIDVSILTGYWETMESICKCSALDANMLYVSHYGLVKDITSKDYFKLSAKCAEIFKDLILKLLGNGYSDEEIMRKCQLEIWEPMVKDHEGQPIEAFDANTKAFLNVIRKDFTDCDDKIS